MRTPSAPVEGEGADLDREPRLSATLGVGIPSAVCVILLLFQLHPEWPLIVAANRDEYYLRRSSGPERLVDSPRVVGGRDLEKGGTWMGFADTGLFVGLTNRRTMGPPEPARRSRGEVVMDALRTGSVEGIERHLGGVDASATNPYNLVFGDAHDLRVAYARDGERSVDVHALGPGLHVLANDSMGTPMPKVQRAETLTRPLSALPWDQLAPALRRVLADHTVPPIADLPAHPAWMDGSLAQRLQSLCVHTPSYGTRSATVAAVGPRGVARYAFAPGPPCTTPLTDATELLRPERTG